jgi:Domain of unknown function (DUF4430)
MKRFRLDSTVPALILIGLSLVIGLGLLVDAAAVHGADDDPAASPVVQLTIDYGDGCEKHFTRIAWREGMTVLDALEAARKHPRGIRFEHRGAGETAFVSQIDELKNQGQGKNWLYHVNGKGGTKSCGLQVVAKDDRILWKFATYR